MSGSVIAARASVETTHPNGLRARKKDATRRALAATALALAVDRGYESITIAEIAAGVGVSRRTFSNYFTSKAACLVAVAEDWTDDLLHQLQNPPPTGSIEDLLQSALVSIAQNTADSWQQVHLIASSAPDVQAQLLALDAETADRATEIVARRLDLPADDLLVELLISFGIAACRTCTERWFAGGRVGGAAGLTALLERAFSMIQISALAATRTEPNSS